MRHELAFAGWGREDWTGRENLIPRASLLPVHSLSRERDLGNNGGEETRLQRCHR